ncbi:MAG TPA: hypothetical protein PKI05_14130 [Thermogutta sp.]|nr:hypothetical protein [Thermogutta sp.]
MQIPATFLRGLFSGVVGQPTRPVERNDQTKPQSADDKTLSDSLMTVLGQSGNPSLWEILKEYDVTHITPRQFSQMLQKLRESGSLTEQEYTELAQIRRDLAEAGVDADEPVDLIDFYQKFIRKLQLMQALGTAESTDDLQTALQRAEKHLKWLEKISTLQTELGTDAWA